MGYRIRFVGLIVLFDIHKGIFIQVVQPFNDIILKFGLGDLKQGNSDTYLLENDRQRVRSIILCIGTRQLEV